jgi:predicted nucleic acid-binding protein
METKLSYLLDTCILIDYLRGNASIYDLLIKEKSIHLYMSTVTMMELILGALNKREVNYIQKAFKEIKIIYIDENISRIAEDLMMPQFANRPPPSMAAGVGSNALFFYFPEIAGSVA